MTAGRLFPIGTICIPLSSLLKGLDSMVSLLGGPGVDLVFILDLPVSILLYVVLDSEGALYSMTAWALDSDGDGYEVAVYYSAAGRLDGTFITLP